MRWALRIEFPSPLGKMTFGVGKFGMNWSKWVTLGLEKVYQGWVLGKTATSAFLSERERAYPGSPSNLIVGQLCMF
ncbi:hypothetical protein SLA2020_104040 [Shorea laevis]